VRRRADLVAVAILLLLPTIYFFDVISGRNAFYFADLVRFHHPGKKVLRDIVLSGEFPYWNPTISAGQPLAANPQHEVFYPLNWLIFLPNFDTGFQLLILVHIALALVAMFALLRSMNLERPAAMLGAFSYGLGGVILSFHHMLPHLFCAAWLPLTLLFARRALLHRRPRDFALASLLLGVEFLIGEPAMLLETALLVGAYALMRGIRERRVVASLLLALAIGVAGLFAGAAQTLPGIDHTRDSVRGRGIAWSVASYWSLPPLRIAELLYPNLFGHMSRGDRMLFWGTSQYPREVSPYLYNPYSGLLIAVLAIAGFATRSRGWKLAAALLLASILLALGAHTPLLRILYDAGFQFIRYFEKFMFFGIVALIIFAATVFQRLLDGDRRVRSAAMMTTGIAMLAAALLARFGPIPANEELRAIARSDWSLAILRGSLLMLLLVAITRVRRPLWLALAALFVVADLTPRIRELTPRTDRSLYEYTPLAAQKLSRVRAPFRIFPEADWYGNTPLARSYVRTFGLRLEPVRNAMLPPIPSEFRLQTAMESDFDFTSLNVTDDFIAAMTKIGYRSASGWPQPMAAMSNAWIRTQYRPLEDALARAQGDVRKLQPVAYLPLQPHPRYYFASSVVSIRNRDDFVRLLKTQRFDNDVAFASIASFAPAHGVVRRTSESANRIHIEADSEGRAFLVISVTPHKYWHVHVDGRNAQPVITNLGYQGLELPRGHHIIEMQYRNPLVAIGGGISIVTMLVLVGLIGRIGQIGR